jgi:preprotein translocase subunit Sec63
MLKDGRVCAVDRQASDKDIRQAYKRLSRKYHPDKNQEPGAEEKFVDVAYGAASPLHLRWISYLCSLSL